MDIYYLREDWLKLGDREKLFRLKVDGFDHFFFERREQIERVTINMANMFTVNGVPPGPFLVEIYDFKSKLLHSFIRLASARTKKFNAPTAISDHAIVTRLEPLDLVECDPNFHNRYRIFL